MRRKTICLALAVCLVLGLTACGAASREAEPAPTEAPATAAPTEAPTTAPTAAPTAEPTPKPKTDRSGFDEETNQELSFAGIRFSIPAYYTEREKATKENYIEFYDSLVSVGAGLAFGKGEVTWTREDYESHLDEVEARLLGSWEKLEKQSSEDISMAGFPGRTVDLVGTGDVANRAAQLSFALNSDAGVLFYVMLVQDMGSDYDYTPDYAKILDSAIKEEAETSPAGVTPEFKAMMDSYEAMVDKYTEFMKNYNSMDAGQMMKYLSILSEYTEFASKIEALDENSMSDADLAYYLEVTGRVSQKLLGAMG